MSPITSFRTMRFQFYCVVFCSTTPTPTTPRNTPFFSLSFPFCFPLPMDFTEQLALLATTRQTDNIPKGQPGPNRYSKRRRDFEGDLKRWTDYTWEWTPSGQTTPRCEHQEDRLQGRQTKPGSGQQEDSLHLEVDTKWTHYTWKWTPRGLTTKKTD